jgi:hypothetical protein
MRGTLLMAVLLLWGTIAASAQQAPSKEAVGTYAEDFFKNNGIKLW